jgi:hypothetical protein
MITRSRRKRDNEDNYEDFRPFPIYVMLCLGILVVLIGLYLLISDRAAVGTTTPGRYGTGGGNQISITGGGAIFVGIVLSLFPVYELIKRKKKN